MSDEASAETGAEVVVTGQFLVYRRHEIGRFVAFWDHAATAEEAERHSEELRQLDPHCVPVIVRIGPVIEAMCRAEWERLDREAVAKAAAAPALPAEMEDRRAIPAWLLGDLGRC